MPAPEGGACPRCDAPHDPGQEYCLDCGLRLPLPATGVVASLGVAWRRRLRWYPGDWIWTALALLAIAALGAAAAVLASRDEPQRRTLVATTSPGVTTAETILSAPTETVTPQPEPPPARTAANPPPPPARRGKLISWPAGQTGWTIVLHSVVTTGDARARARRAVRAGLRAGVLNSSDYASLRPGYYVVFTGVYDSRDRAEAALDDARERGYASPYVRQVLP
jgi:hypothetical protein